MNKLKNLSFLLALMLMVTSFSFTSCSDDDDDDTTTKFTIVNESGRDFYGIMMSPSSQSTWSDILEKDTFEDGSSVVITFNFGKSQKWDIRLFEDKDDIDNGYIEFTNLDLTGRTKLKIYKKGSETWYSLE